MVGQPSNKIYVLCCIELYCIVLQCSELYFTVVSVLYFTVLYCSVLYCSVLYYFLSHALKNTANQRPGLPLHILRYATGNMQRVVFHSTFPSFLARNSLLGSIWGLLKSELRNLSTPANHYEHFRSHHEIVSEHFRRFPKILKSHKNIWKFFWTVSEVFRKCPKISEHFRRFSEN